MTEIKNSADIGLIDPQARIKHLANYGNMVEVDPNVPIRRYYRSGMEMVRMANVYVSEGNYENAYILYIKFMTLFIEKIRSHPEYKSTPPTIRKPNQEKLKEVMPITEKLKERLLVKFKKDYIKYLENLELEKEREAAQRAKDELNKKDRSNLPPIAGTVGTLIDKTYPSAPNLDEIVYPNDFPNEPNKSTTGLILPPASPPASSSGGGPTSNKPKFDRTLKPLEHSDSLIEGLLRPVVVPQDTMTKFLILANENTINNIETCGILAGKLAQNKLFITHIIVPKQKGTADSCNTMNEEDIFDIQDQQNLITLGWIHTHPSQTAFLSSVDLHTHCSYQIMMPEAIAIVCAPKYHSTGFFCLTPSYGLDFISQCRQSGFHPHPNDPPLFMEAPHVVVDQNTKIEVVDIRR